MVLRIIFFILFSMVGAANAELTLSSKDLSIGVKSSCSSRRDSNADVVKLAHVIGSDSRTSVFSYDERSGYYNSDLQSRMAKNNLSHIQCKDGDEWKTNTTSGFFVDIEDFARNSNMAGDFSACRNKVLVTVSHYINDRGGESAKCKVRKTFETNLGSSEYGNVKAIQVGDKYSSDYNLDFAFLKIDNLRNSQDSNFKTLKICTDLVAAKSASGSKCDRYFRDQIILPHLARYNKDKAAANLGFDYKAKETSGKCCISGKVNDLNLLSHTCDMDERSSGAPLLSIEGSGEPCVLGIQKGHSGFNSSIKENYAVSVTDEAFKTQFKRYIESNCGKKPILTLTN